MSKNSGRSGKNGVGVDGVVATSENISSTEALQVRFPLKIWVSVVVDLHCAEGVVLC